MDSEDELLCVLAAVKIQRKKKKKNYEKEEKTQDMASADLQRRREVWCIKSS